MRYLLIISILLFSIEFSFADETNEDQTLTQPEKSIRLISPVGTMVRSAIIPGWGQYHSRNYFRGGLVQIGIVSSVVGAYLAHQSFSTHYDNYLLTASNEPDDAFTVLESYDAANQKYKLQMFFIYSGIGFWVYSIIDSYVSSNFYNAKSQIQSIKEDAQQIEKLGLQVGITPSRMYLGFVKTF